MSALPGSFLEPLWAQFAALLLKHPPVDPIHPLGCHRRLVSDRVVFEHVVTALVHGSGYERIATPITPSVAGCTRGPRRASPHTSTRWCSPNLIG